MKNRKFLKKFKIKLPYDATIPLLVIYPKKVNKILNRYLYFHVHGSIIHNSQDMETVLSAIHG